MTKRQKKKSEIQKKESDKLKRLKRLERFAEKYKQMSNDAKARLEEDFSDSVLENGLNS
jgi:hypothetical protein